MNYFKEEINDQLVVIDNEAFFADGIRFPLNELWGVRGVYYELSENIATATTEGLGTVVASASGCILKPIFGLSVVTLVIVVILVLGEGASLGFIWFPLCVAVVSFFLIKGIGSGTNKVIESVATKTFYLLIVTASGEHKVLVGMPKDFLEKVCIRLNQALDANRIK